MQDVSSGIIITLFCVTFKKQSCSIFILREGLLLQGLVCLINLFNLWCGGETFNLKRVQKIEFILLSSAPSL